MSNAALQILQMLGYLAIGLISVTVPLYALCVAYLHREKQEAEMERKSRIETLKGQITMLTDKLSGEKADSRRFKEIEKRMKEHKAELKGLKQKVGLLTAKGAVRNPLVLLILALSSSAAGIFFLYSGLEQYVVFASLCGFGSAVCSGWALYSLYATVSTVEHAALRKVRSVPFRVAFKSTSVETREIKCARKVLVSIGARAEENLGNVSIHVFFPPEIKIRKSSAGTVSTTQPKGSTYPDYVMVARKYPFFVAQTYHAIGLELEVEKPGQYKIPVEVYAKGVKTYAIELILNVVK